MIAPLFTEKYHCGQEGTSMQSQPTKNLRAVIIVAVADIGLYGNSKKKERGSYGLPDQNVFDVQQGVHLKSL